MLRVAGAGKEPASAFHLLKTLLLLHIALLAVACKGTVDGETAAADRPDAADQPVAVDTTAATDKPARKYNFPLLREKIIFGQARLVEVLAAMTEQDKVGLTNTAHALFSMKWHRGVYKLMDVLWESNREKYPDLAWDLIEAPPVRIALASTLNRARIKDTKPYQSYIRQYKEDPHEFIRAQVVIALGFNGDPADLEYILDMARGENLYVAQTAITSLGLMGNPEAKNALLALREHYRNSRLLNVVNAILMEAYKWTPAVGAGSG